MSEATTEAEESPVKYRFTIDQPGLGDQLIQVPGLGTFENGGTYDVTEEEAEAYRNYHQRQVHIYGDNNEVLGSSVEPGLSLLDAGPRMIGVTVVDVQSGESSDDLPEPEPEPVIVEEPEDHNLVVSDENPEGSDQ